MTYDYNLLMNKAKEASKTSYSPFSKFAVGAAVLAKSGAVYTGCNVENSSFGLTICAERCAIFKAISEGEREILAVAIFSPNEDDCFPCGACRQVMYEFQGENEIEIILVFFDKRSFQLSVQIVGDIDSYIDANYVRESHRKEYPVRSRSNARMRGLTEERE